MQPAGAGARNDADLAAHGTPIFGCRYRGNDGELLDRFIGWLEVDDAVLPHNCWHAIQQVGIRSAARAVDAECALCVFSRLAVAIGGSGEIPACRNSGDDECKILELATVTG